MNNKLKSTANRDLWDDGVLILTKCAIKAKLES